MIAPIWSREAQADLAGIDDFYRPLNFAFAQRTLTAAVVAADFLAEYPRAGQIIEQTTSRKWRVRGTPYILIYRESSTEVRIVRVAHTSTNWRHLL